MNDELNASIEMIQRITGASTKTIKRWKNGTSTCCCRLKTDHLCRLKIDQAL